MNPGAETLINAVKKAVYKILLLSGGFTVFTDALKERFGFDFTRSNVLEIKNGKLTGKLIDQPWGDICDGEEKNAACLLPVKNSILPPSNLLLWEMVPMTFP